MAGGNNPFGGSSIQVADHIQTSDSVISIPLYDPGQFGGTPPLSRAAATVIGYLQVFIDQVHNNGGMDVTVLNVSGCGNAPTGTAILGAATSVPVRLIQP